MLFGSLSTRDRRHLARVHQSWRSIRRLAEHPYEAPRVERAWQEVKDLHTWPTLDQLSLTERLLLSGSVVPEEAAGRPSRIDLSSFPIVATCLVLLAGLILAGSQLGPALGAQAEAAWKAFLEGPQLPAPTAEPERVVIILPTSTATPTGTPTRTPTPAPTAVAQAPPPATPTPSPSATPTPSPTPAPPSPTPAPPPPTPPPTATPAGRRAKSVIEGIIRSQPHHTSSRVGRLPAGATVEVIQVVRGSAPFPPENRWIEIRMGDLRGFVYWSLLDLPSQ